MEALEWARVWSIIISVPVVQDGSGEVLLLEGQSGLHHALVSAGSVSVLWRLCWNPGGCRFRTMTGDFWVLTECPSVLKGDMLCTFRTKQPFITSFETATP